jgi:acyl-CoA dehydrogenase
MTFQGYDLPDELRVLADTIGEFVREEIRPVEDSLPPESRGLPEHELRRLQSKAKDLGFWCLDAPSEYGGGGLSLFESVVVTEQMAKHRFGMPTPGAEVFGVNPPIALYSGSPEQIQQYVIPAIENAWSAYTAISEPSGGSDPARAIMTTATVEGDTYRINGRKMWTTHADEAKFGVVYARTDRAAGRKGISAIIVDGGSPGVTVTSIPVLRDHWTNEVTFEDVIVPCSNLIGEEGRGFDLAQNWLLRGRVRYAAMSVGVAEEAVRIAVEWAQERKTFGALLATRQAVQFAIADARVHIEAARHLTWAAAYQHDQGKDFRVAASIAKLFGTEMAFTVVDGMMQILGGMGVAMDMPLEHWFRALRVSRIVEGPSEIQRFIIARDILGKAAVSGRD